MLSKSSSSVLLRNESDKSSSKSDGVEAKLTKLTNCLNRSSCELIIVLPRRIRLSIAERIRSHFIIRSVIFSYHFQKNSLSVSEKDYQMNTVAKYIVYRNKMLSIDITDRK